MDGAFFPPLLIPSQSATAARHGGWLPGKETRHHRARQTAEQRYAVIRFAGTDPVAVAGGHRRPTVLGVHAAATPPLGDGQPLPLSPPRPPPTLAAAAHPPGGATGATVLRLLVAVAPLFRDPPPVGGGGGDTASGVRSSGGESSCGSGDGGSGDAGGSRGAGRGGVVDKVDGTPVTATDYAVQAMMAAWLPQGEALLAEEGVEGWDVAPPDVRAAAVAAFTRVMGGRAADSCDDGADIGGDGGEMAVAGPAVPPPNLRSLLGVGGVAWTPHPATTPAAGTAAAVATADTNGGLRLWVVDPIDGTAGYVGGRGRYALGVGVVDERGVATAGLLLGGGGGEGEGAAALSDGGLRLAVAARGEGVEWYTPDGAVAIDRGGTPLGWGLETSRPTTPAETDKPPAVQAATAAAVSDGGGVLPPVPWTVSGAAPPGAVSRLFVSRGGNFPVRLCCGSLVKYAAVAAGVVGRAVIWAGRGDGGGTVAVWDHAAGVGVVEASGGRVTALGRADAVWAAGAVGEGGRVFVGDAVVVTAAGVDHAAWVAEVHAALRGEA